MYALVEWTDEEKVSTITLSRIKEPRKDFCDYKVGDIVKASCHGFPGVHPAKILAIRGILTIIRLEYLNNLLIINHKIYSTSTIETFEIILIIQNINRQYPNIKIYSTAEQSRPNITGSTTDGKKQLEKMAEDYIAEKNQVQTERGATKKGRKSTEKKDDPVKKAKSQENKENKAEREKKREENKKKREIGLKKNADFLQSLQVFKNQTPPTNQQDQSSQPQTQTQFPSSQHPNNNMNQPDLSLNQMCHPFQPNNGQQLLPLDGPSPSHQQFHPHHGNAQQHFQPNLSYPQQQQFHGQNQGTPHQQQFHQGTPHQQQFHQSVPHLQQFHQGTPHAATVPSGYATPATVPPGHVTPATVPPGHTTPASVPHFGQPPDHQSNPDDTNQGKQEKQPPKKKSATRLSFAEIPGMSEEISRGNQILDEFLENTADNTDEFGEPDTMQCDCCKAALKEKERELEEVKRQLFQAREELEQQKSSNRMQLTTGEWNTQKDGYPRAGRVPKEIAENHSMMELMPGSGIYVYPKDVRALSKKNSGTGMARYLMSVFYTNEELVRRGNLTGANGKEGLDKSILKTIIDYAVIKGRDVESNVNYNFLYFLCTCCIYVEIKDENYKRGVVFIIIVIVIIVVCKKKKNNNTVDPTREGAANKNKEGTTETDSRRSSGYDSLRKKNQEYQGENPRTEDQVAF
ncbi:hypothetical protein KUTeg_013160 [Tegillarca granosa]|uniref:BEN domain-containing protein n=1 Tax=Tegillarca granosa TaxID=220873 RepID=A0ABQ9ESW2_TEGGR|nr:hypothetical protein KUTeg_013160 [Tegillarca granosa]